MGKRTLLFAPWAATALFVALLSPGCGAASGRGLTTSSGDLSFYFPPLDGGFGEGDLAGTLPLDLSAGPTVDLAAPAPPDLAVDPCLARAKLIYTIDQDNTLRSFDATTLKFNVIGVLNCPAQNGSQPFSMGVDANATAWVLYESGEIFLVDTSTAKCSASKYTPNQNGYDEFGMGFVADKSGALDEHLYIAGLDNMELAVVDPITLVPSSIGALNGNPELTGTGGGLLWGFFPDAQMPRVAQLDKTTAKEGTTFQLQALAGTPEAWAFAFWGGDFWIFLQRDTDNSTHVWHLESATGNVTDAFPNTGFSVVGAGVSICAPISPTH